MYFILTVYSDSDVKVSSEILGLYLSVLNFTVGKVHSPTQVVPMYFKVFQK